MKASIELPRWLLAGIATVLTGCAGDRPKEGPPSASAHETEPALPGTDSALPPDTLETHLSPAVRAALLKAWTGDLDAMARRRIVRVGTTFNRTFYFVDKGVQRGVVYEYGQLMAERLNQHFKTGTGDRIQVVFLALPRDILLSALAEGRVDMVAAQLTVTPELREQVDFSDPTRTNVRQILVTGPGGPAISSVADLPRREVFARTQGGYDRGLLALNESFRVQGKPPIVIRKPPASLEDDDLLEMVNAGLIPAVVVDDYLAAFWKKVFPNLRVHDSIALATGGSLAIAVRKHSPQLLAALNTFMGRYGLGSAFGNQIERRYLVNTGYAASATSENGRKKFSAVVDLFRKYGAQYQVDFLLMAAQGFQESQLNQAVRSPAGAIGIMQVMPATGRELHVGDIRQVEPNIHAGVKYMRALRDRYFANEPMDDLNRGLFTFAAYNAGPGRVQQLRRLAEARGLDPNVWFGNVEQIASERIGRETVTYVANIFKYYVAYRLVVEEDERREAARKAVQRR